MKDFVFSEQSLITFANNLTQDMFEKEVFKSPKEYYNISYEDYEVFLTSNIKDQHFDTLPLIIFQNANIDFKKFSPSDISNILIEVYRVVTQLLQKKGTDIFSPSVVYRKHCFIVLKILENYHLFIQVNFKQSRNIIVYRLTEDKDENVENFKPDETSYNLIISHKDQIFQDYKDLMETNALAAIDDNYNFDLIYNKKSETLYTYNEWVNALSKSQLAFLNNSSKKALRLKGPAGTGKTLVMELKAIKILREEPEVRVLYTCHSWSVAIQVSDFFDRVAPECTDRIEVWPLLTVAQNSLGKNLVSVQTLGDDSYTGKREQIEILTSLITDFINNEWELYKNSCDKIFIKHMESILDGNNNFVWAIMTEISNVIGANGIMPGKNSFQKYDKIERRSWMLNLLSSNERNVIFIIYSKYMAYLRDKKIITSDQIIKDYLNSLTTYNWYYERQTKGYACIFVDEMQLFNDQERLVLPYLSSIPDEYPRIYMAMDPKQAVDHVYGDLGITDIVNQLNPEVDASIGSADFHLDVAYRYSQEILEFLKHIDSSYPTMGFKDYWNNRIQGTKAFRKRINEPVDYISFKNMSDVIKNTIEISENYTKSGQQVAILALNDISFTKLKEKENKSIYLKSVNSMKDTTALIYTKKKVVISRPNYIIGLQFDVVIIIGCGFDYETDNQSYIFYERQYLSDLYLAASRAKNKLILIGNKDEKLPNVIQKAIEKGFVIESHRRTESRS